MNKERMGTVIRDTRENSAKHVSSDYLNFDGELSVDRLLTLLGQKLSVYECEPMDTVR